MAFLTGAVFSALGFYNFGFYRTEMKVLVVRDIFDQDISDALLANEESALLLSESINTSSFSNKVFDFDPEIIEQMADNRLIRPAAAYKGPMDQHYIPIEKR